MQLNEQQPPNPPSFLARRWRRARAFLERGIWRVDESSLPSLKSGLLRFSRVILLTVRGFLRDNCLMRAGSLTYVTIFSLVPLLAFSFALAKGFGADKHLESAIGRLLDETFGLGGGEAELVAPVDEVAQELPELGPGEVPPPDGIEEGSESAEGALVGTSEPGPPSISEPGSESESDPAAEEPAPAGEQLRQAMDQVFAFVRETNFARLGAFSLAFLLYCVIKLLGAVERSMNDIWGLKSTRAFTRRVTNYLAIVVMAPIVVVTATGVTALFQGDGLSDWLPGEVSLSPLVALLPFGVVSAGMTFLYIALPDTKVRFVSALFGGVVAGSCWQLAQIMHVQFQVGVARINAIYSGFAALPLFLLWVYVNWSVLLLGAQLAYAHQNEPLHTSMAQAGEVDQRFREGLALRLAGRIAAAFLSGQAAPSSGFLARDLGMSARVVGQVLQQLVAHGLVARTDEEGDRGYLPARQPDSIRVLDVLHAMRREPGSEVLPVRNSAHRQHPRPHGPGARGLAEQQGPDRARAYRHQRRRQPRRRRAGDGGGRGRPPALHALICRKASAAQLGDELDQLDPVVAHVHFVVDRPQDALLIDHEGDPLAPAAVLRQDPVLPGDAGVRIGEQNEVEPLLLVERGLVTNRVEADPHHANPGLREIPRCVPQRADLERSPGGERLRVEGHRRPGVGRAPHARDPAGVVVETEGGCRFADRGEGRFRGFGVLKSHEGRTSGQGQCCDSHGEVPAGKGCGVGSEANAGPWPIGSRPSESPSPRACAEPPGPRSLPG